MPHKLAWKFIYVPRLVLYMKRSEKCGVDWTGFSRFSFLPHGEDFVEKGRPEAWAWGTRCATLTRFRERKRDILSNRLMPADRDELHSLDVRTSWQTLSLDTHLSPCPIPGVDLDR